MYFFTSKPQVIKLLPKSDIAIVQLDIWNIQSKSKAKCLINKCFNIESFIVTIQRANIKFSIFQYKNCQKQGYINFAYQFQGSQCIKCNNSYKTKYYCYFAWYCKVNFKINLLYLETKQSEPYSYTFKCLNYKDDYQADSNSCLFWKYFFNKE